MQADRVQRIFEALSSPIRREILWLTWHDELTVGDIAAHFELSGPTLSAHLAALRAAKLVTMRVDGNFRRYRSDHDAVQAVVSLLAVEDERWFEADALPERALASTRRSQLVTVTVEVELDPASVFDAFTDADQYSTWLGVPVRIDAAGNFAATLEWGTEVRGHYDVVVKPELIAMTWDFDDDAIPMPGRQLIGYIRIEPNGRQSRIEVHQHAADDVQAAFLTTAWSMVLGRFAAAHAPGGHAARRRPRQKRST